MTSSKGRGHHLQGYSLNCHTGRAMSFVPFVTEQSISPFFQALELVAPRPWLVSERVSFVRSTVHA